MTEKHEWFYPDFDNSAYAHCVKCPAVLEPKEIAIRLNEYETLKKATERLSAEDARFASKRLDNSWDDDEGTIESLQAYADILEG